MREKRRQAIEVVETFIGATLVAITTANENITCTGIALRFSDGRTLVIGVGGGEIEDCSPYLVVKSVGE